MTDVFRRQVASPMVNGAFHIAAAIGRNASHHPVYMVGIDGLGGSGKSMLADRIRQQLELGDRTVVTVRTDDFYLPSASRNQLPANLKPVGADFDWVRLRDQVLVPLRSGRIACYAPYDWLLDRLAEDRKIEPYGIILIEGVYSTRAELRDFFDFRIWVDCPREVRLSRGLARDGDSARSRWVDDWMPSEDRYFVEHRPDTFAHVVVNGVIT